MSEWEKVKLSEIGDIVGGSTPSTTNPENYGGSIAWLTPKDLSDYQYRYISHGERNITEIGLSSCSAKLLPKHSIIFSSRAPIGYVAISKNEIATNQGFKSIIPNERVNYLFLYYLLKYNKEYIESLGTGTTFKEVSGTVMKNVEVQIPKDIETQKKIAAVLSSLDDKIELNTRMNKVLEEIAQTLFKRWFVDFEFPDGQGKPYKSNGGRMVESEIGMIPEGWGVKTIDEVVSICGGGTPSTTNKEFWEAGTNPFCTPKDLSQLSSSFLLETEQHITDLGVQSISSKQLPSGTLLLSSRAPIGYLVIAEIPISINQGFIAMICNGPVSNHFMLQWNKENLELIKGRANGSTFLEISKKNYRTIPFLLPTNELLTKYEKIVGPIYQKISCLSKENKRLVEIRDILLPKLMNGEIGQLI